MAPTDTLDDFETAVRAERVAQIAEFGEQNHLDGTGPRYEIIQRDMKRITDRLHNEGEDRWAPILLEEIYEAVSETDWDKLKAELIQCAAVIKAWIECIDRRQNP